jgi:hypothetical protein
MRVLHIDTGREMRGGQRQVEYLVEGLGERGVDCLVLAPAHSPLHGCRLPVAEFSVGRLRREPADLIHAHDSRAHSLALWARAPVVVSRRVAFARRPGALSRWKYGRARRILAISEFVKRLLLAEGVAEERIGVVADGVPLLPLSRRETGVVVRVEKGRNLRDDLGNASVVVYESEMEGLGSAALLAQSAGVPVVASRIGGLPEAIADGETGILVDGSQEIAPAVRSLLDDAERLDRFSRAARLRIEAQFTVERMVTRTLEEYARALA